MKDVIIKKEYNIFTLADLQLLEFYEAASKILN